MGFGSGNRPIARMRAAPARLAGPRGTMDGSVATSSDTGKKRFADLVRLHAQKAKFITREQEIKLLEEG